MTQSSLVIPFVTTRGTVTRLNNEIQQTIFNNRLLFGPQAAQAMGIPPTDDFVDDLVAVYGDTPDAIQ